MKGCAAAGRLLSKQTADCHRMDRSQLRMARAALQWTAEDLAARAGVNVNTVRRFEQGKDALLGTVEKMRRALEAEGLEFIADGASSRDGGPGIRFRKRQAATASAS